MLHKKFSIKNANRLFISLFIKVQNNYGLSGLFLNIKKRRTNISFNFKRSFWLKITINVQNPFICNLQKKSKSRIDIHKIFNDQKILKRNLEAINRVRRELVRLSFLSITICLL